MQSIPEMECGISRMRKEKATIIIDTRVVLLVFWAYLGGRLAFVFVSFPGIETHHGAQPSNGSKNDESVVYCRNQAT